MIEKDSNSKLNREKRRVFVRTAASCMTFLSPVVLSVESAGMLATAIKELVEFSQSSGISFYLDLLKSCQSLAASVEKNLMTPKHLTEAAEVLKESLIAIQTSLFSFALQGETLKDQTRFQTLNMRIEVLQKSHEKTSFRARSADKQEARKEEKKSSLHAHPVAHVNANSNVNANSQGGVATQELLSSIVDTIRLLWEMADTSSHRQAISLCQQARVSFGIPFSVVCENVQQLSGFRLSCSTPKILIESTMADAMKKRILDWLSSQQKNLDNISLSVRAFGRSVELELAINGTFVVSQRNFSRSERLNDLFFKADGSLILKQKFIQSLPLAEAHEVKLQGKSYLLPADVVRVEENLPTNINLSDVPEISGSKIINFRKSTQQDLSNDVSATEAEKVLVQWREIFFYIKVETKGIPSFYLGESDPQHSKQVFHLASSPGGGASCEVIDLFDLLDDTIKVFGNSLLDELEQQVKTKSLKQAA